MSLLNDTEARLLGPFGNGRPFELERFPPLLVICCAITRVATVPALPNLWSRGAKHDPDIGHVGVMDDRIAARSERGRIRRGEANTSGGSMWTKLSNDRMKSAEESGAGTDEPSVSRYSTWPASPNRLLQDSGTRG